MAPRRSSSAPNPRSTASRTSRPASPRSWTRPWTCRCSLPANSAPRGSWTASGTVARSSRSPPMTQTVDGRSGGSSARIITTANIYSQSAWSTSSSDLDTAAWLSTKFQGFTVFTFSSEVVARACKAGALQILRFFHENDSRFLEERGDIGRGHPTEWGGLTMSAAVLSRRSDVVWWLNRHIPDADFDLEAAFRSALTTGDVLAAEWLVDQGPRWPERHDGTVRGVVASGRLDVLQWLVELGQRDPGIALVCTAAGAGHLDVARWIIERTLQSHAEIAHPIMVIAVAALSIHNAAVHGHLSVAKYLREIAKGPVHGVQLPGDEIDNLQHLVVEASPEAHKVEGRTMVLAARNGFVHVVKWLYEEYNSDPDMDIFTYGATQAWQTSADTSAMDAAAGRGHLDVLRYLHELQAVGETRLLCTADAMNRAAANGHLSAVQWLHNNRGEGCSTA